jgi:threonine/homoserine/homoserine lactone efflux protein
MLINTQHLFLFLTATLLLNLTPGNDVIYITSQSVYSFKQGVCAVFGTSTGIIIYILATSLGLTTILQHSPLVFNLIKMVGAVYLLYLAWQMFFSTHKNTSLTASKKIHYWKSYKKGLLTNLLNPKIGIFFITFLPQFADTAMGHVGLQLLIFGLIFITSGTIVNLIYAGLFSTLKSKVSANLTMKKWLNKCTALIFCFLAFRVLVAQRN